MKVAHSKPGFTLIELIVTMGLIITLLSIAVAISNSATFDSYKIVGAGDRVSQAFITAKSRAARDKSPRGVRLVADPATGMVRELYYIEQPEPFLPDQSATIVSNVTSQPIRSFLALYYPQNPAAVPPNYPTPLSTQCKAYLVLSTIDRPRFVKFLNTEISISDFGPTPNNPTPPVGTTFSSTSSYLASSPDFGAGFSFSSMRIAAPTGFTIPLGFVCFELTITSISSPDLSAGQTPLQPATTLGQATVQTPNFGIYLPPKPLAGEPSLILPRETAVDLTVSLPSYATPFSNVDVLFAPAGHVMYRGESLIGFLIRDTRKLPAPIAPGAGYTWLNDPTNGARNFKLAGEMTIVALYPKSGTVFTKPVAETGSSNSNDPFFFCRDPIANSGL